MRPPPEPPRDDEDDEAWEEWDRRQTTWTVDLMDSIYARAPKLRLRDVFRPGARARQTQAVGDWMETQLSAAGAAGALNRDFDLNAPEGVDAQFMALSQQILDLPDVRMVGMTAHRSQPIIIRVHLDPYTEGRADHLRALCQPYRVRFVHRTQ